MCNEHKNFVSPYNPTKLAIYSILLPDDDLQSNCGQNIKNLASFSDIVYFIVEENIVNYENFDCGFTFYTETSTKIRQINRERNYVCRSCEKLNCIPSDDQYSYSIDKQHNCNIYLNQYNLWDMVPTTIMSLNHTNDRYSMSN